MEMVEKNEDVSRMTSLRNSDVSHSFLELTTLPTI